MFVKLWKAVYSHAQILGTVTHRIHEWHNERSIVGEGLLSLGGIIRALDLEGFTVSLLELSHFEILLRSLFMIELNWDGVGAEKTKHVSSANNRECS